MRPPNITANFPLKASLARVHADGIRDLFNGSTSKRYREKPFLRPKTNDLLSKTDFLCWDTTDDSETEGEELQLKPEFRKPLPIGLVEGGGRPFQKKGKNRPFYFYEEGRIRWSCHPCCFGWKILPFIHRLVNLSSSFCCVFPIFAIHGLWTLLTR